MKALPLSLATIFGALGSIYTLGAVAVTTPELQQNAFIIKVVAPEQEFYFRDGRRITNLSLQKYVSAQATEVSRGAASAQYVTEMSFDLADSPLVVRIYSMEVFDPTRIQTSERTKKIRSTAKKVVNAATKTNVTNVAEYLVVKSYPQTTHAKTIEIRLPTSDEVEEFYDVFKEYFNRERWDYQYSGALKSSQSKLKSQKQWLGLDGSVKSPAKEWSNAYDKKLVSRGAASGFISVSGLSGLCFTLGVEDTVAAEIEAKDVAEE